MHVLRILGEPSRIQRLMPTLLYDTMSSCIERGAQDVTHHPSCVCRRQGGIWQAALWAAAALHRQP